jgi:hypothetical protein
MKSAGRTARASGAQPASVLEVVGHGVGHVYVSRRAAEVLAPGGAPILPPLVALVMAHKANTHARTECTEHRYRDTVLCVVHTATATVVGCQGEQVGADA